MFCIVWLYLYCCWRYNYQEKYDWCLINQFNHATIGVLSQVFISIYNCGGYFAAHHDQLCV